MVFKNGDKEFQLEGRGDVFLGTLVVVGGTFVINRVIGVFNTVAKREDLPEVLDKSTKVVNMEDFRKKPKNNKRKY